MDPAIEPILTALHRQESFLLGFALVLIVGSTIVYLAIAILRFALLLLRQAAKDLSLLKIELQHTLSEFKKLFGGITQRLSGSSVALAILLLVVLLLLMFSRQFASAAVLVRSSLPVL